MQQTAIKAGNILENALNVGWLNLFVEAVQQTELAEILAQEGPYTVCAPTDKAFREFTPKTFNELMSNKDELMTVLAYHVIPGIYKESALSRQSGILTLLGKEFSLGNAHVVQPDIECSNGIIQVIDSIIIPQ